MPRHPPCALKNFIHFSDLVRAAETPKRSAARLPPSHAVCKRPKARCRSKALSKIGSSIRIHRSEAHSGRSARAPSTGSRLNGSTLARLPRKCAGSPKGGDPAAGSPTATLLRLHPNHRTDRWRLSPLRVEAPTSGPSNFRGVTGGVYKARERIHRGMLIRDY